jgi:hypothetical protein
LDFGTDDASFNSDPPLCLACSVNDSATKGMEVEEMGDRHIGRGLSQTATVFTTILCR